MKWTLERNLMAFPSWGEGGKEYKNARCKKWNIFWFDRLKTYPWTTCCFIFPLTFIRQTLLSSSGLLKYAFHHFFFWSENKWKMMLEIVGSIKGSTTLICQFKSSFLKPTFWIFDHLYFMLNKLSTIYKGF